MVSAKVNIEPILQRGMLPALDDLAFGKHFTDYMAYAEFDAEHGWKNASLVRTQDLAKHPSSQVFQYGVACFEGMKAFRGVDGKPRLFRPNLNMERFKRSCRSLTLPTYATEDLLDLIKDLVRLEDRFLPHEDGYSLYIRPFMFSTTKALGVSPSTSAALCILASPSGPYYKEGVRPIKLFLEEEYIRAWPGGLGNVKVAGNYAGTLRSLKQAQAMGCAQSLFCFRSPSSSLASATVSECAAMNVFALVRETDGSRPHLVTHPLDDGTILPGVTRASIIELCQDLGLAEIQERPITIGELERLSMQGKLLELFGCGTACTVQPVSSIVRLSGEEIIPRNPYRSHSLAARLLEYLKKIQRGEVQHKNWSAIC